MCVFSQGQHRCGVATKRYDAFFRFFFIVVQFSANSARVTLTIHVYVYI